MSDLVLPLIPHPLSPEPVVDFLEGPADLVLAKADVKAEETPAYDLALLTEAGGEYVMFKTGTKRLGLWTEWTEVPEPEPVEEPEPEPEPSESADALRASAIRVYWTEGPGAQPNPEWTKEWTKGDKVECVNCGRVVCVRRDGVTPVRHNVTNERGAAQCAAEGSSPVRQDSAE